MGYSKYDLMRLNAGLCLACGAVRGVGSTQTRCSACAEKMRLYSHLRPKTAPNHSPQTRENIRLYHARRYADLAAAGLCTLCGRLRTAEETARGLVCVDCHGHRKTLSERVRQKKRDQAAGIPEGNAYHWPSGVLHVLPKGDGESLRLHLNGRSNDALLNLWAVYRKAELSAGRQPHNRRVSQLVREAIHLWKDRLIGPSPYPATLMVRSITVYLDPETLRILQWQARACFKNNKSAALRMILTTVGYPRPVPVVLPRHRDKWYEEE